MTTEKKKAVPYTITVVHTNAFGYAQQEDGQVLMPVNEGEMGLLHAMRNQKLEATEMFSLLSDVEFYSPERLLTYWADIAELLMILQCSPDHECVDKQHLEGMVAIRNILQRFVPVV